MVMKQNLYLRQGVQLRIFALDYESVHDAHRRKGGVVSAQLYAITPIYANPKSNEIVGPMRRLSLTCPFGTT